jgi:hypothetical protein
VPWVTPPTWVDPQQHPLRNTMHTALTTARTLAEQLPLHWDDTG